MNMLLRLGAAPVCVLACTLSAAAADGDGVPRAAQTPSANAGTPPATRAPAPPDLRVIEDDHVRIEELRVRGQVRRVTVQSKVQGAREYEILVGHGGRDPSQDRGNAGRAAWRILGF
jgi:hypothetical protein